MDGEMRQRLRGGGRDGSERRALDVKEEAERRNDSSPAISGVQYRWPRTHCLNLTRRVALGHLRGSSMSGARASPPGRRLPEWALPRDAGADEDDEDEGEAEARECKRHAR